ncbi:hypothetical protein BCR36DRAFT_287386 [Piromyces finnis]|uniref:DNA replication regulator Sld3 C-terminal domain-containing protein n=1 Tax=Piromyces finnis TaxID=1754191 RepID=A0A1Y1VCC6_9FUNG|nr:hypothetical protein BCR36DRAFT_287386 [Piromyces finnis]|eukprot:ORX51809.1 hypothetical protein BCR36DRAFT_287386 [Piromyces finnis]
MYYFIIIHYHYFLLDNREQKQSLFKYMDTFKKNSEYEFLSKLSKDIPPFSLKRKSINVVNLIDTNIVDSAWLEGQEYFCQLSHDLEEMEDLISSLFFFKAMNLLKLGMIVEVYLNIRIKNNSDEEFNNDGDLSLLSNDDTEDYESKKYYGILIPLTECFGFIRIINSQAAETIQSYIRSMKKRTSPKQENIFKHLSEDDLFELLSIDLINKSTEDNEINHHEFSMNYLERWYKSILNNFNSTEVKKINLTELMLLSPNSENVLPKEKKDNSKNHSKKSTNKNQYQLFTQDGIIELYRKREKEKAQLEKQMEENQNNDENSEHGNSGKEEQEEKKKKKTVKDIINNLKSLIYNIIYYEKNMVEDFGQTLNTIHNKLFSEEDANEKIKTTKEDGDRSIDSVSTESLDFDEKNDENSREEMKKLYLSTLETAIVMTPEQIDHKYKNFVNYINALSTISHSSDSNENASDKSDHECENNPSLPNTINKNDFFEEGIITEEEEGQIQAWKLHNEKEMDKIEEKVTRMKIEEAQIQVIVLLEYLRLHKKEKINFPDVLLDAENHPPTNLYSKKKEFKKPRKKSDTTIIKNILETLMDKLCIWMTLDQFPAFDSVNTLDNELSDDKITNFVNCILKEL